MIVAFYGVRITAGCSSGCRLSEPCHLHPHLPTDTGGGGAARDGGRRSRRPRGALNCCAGGSPRAPVCWLHRCRARVRCVVRAVDATAPGAGRRRRRRRRGRRWSHGWCWRCRRWEREQPRKRQYNCERERERERERKRRGVGWWRRLWVRDDETFPEIDTEDGMKGMDSFKKFGR